MRFCFYNKIPYNSYNIYHWLYVIIFYATLFFRCSSPSKLIGPRNVYNVSSATLTSYTSYSDGDSLDASLPNHLGLPVVKQKKSKTSLGTRAREKKILSSIRNFLIVLALSIHSVFEGMAIGKDNNFLTSFVLTSFSWLVVKQKKSKTSLGTRAREKNILASIRNFLIVLALSIHSVFEGMAYGNR